MPSNNPQNLIVGGVYLVTPTFLRPDKRERLTRLVRILHTQPNAVTWEELTDGPEGPGRKCRVDGTVCEDGQQHIWYRGDERSTFYSIYDFTLTAFDPTTLKPPSPRKPKPNRFATIITPGAKQ